MTSSRPIFHHRIQIGDRCYLARGLRLLPPAAVQPAHAPSSAASLILRACDTVLVYFLFNNSSTFCILNLTIDLDWLNRSHRSRQPPRQLTSLDCPVAPTVGRVDRSVGSLQTPQSNLTRLGFTSDVSRRRISSSQRKHSPLRFLLSIQNRIWRKGFSHRLL